MPATCDRKPLIQYVALPYVGAIFVGASTVLNLAKCAISVTRPMDLLPCLSFIIHSYSYSFSLFLPIIYFLSSTCQSFSRCLTVNKQVPQSCSQCPVKSMHEAFKVLKLKMKSKKKFQSAGSRSNTGLLYD